MGRNHVTKVNIIRRVTTPTAPFRFIVYATKNGEYLLEKPDESFCTKLSEGEVQYYLKTNNTNIKSTKLIDDRFIFIKQNRIHFTYKMTEEINWVNLSININGLIPNDFVDDNFSYCKSPTHKYSHLIEGRFPLLPLWVTTVQEYTLSDSYQPSIFPKGLSMEYKNKFYRFPYGNVDTRNSICLGNGAHAFTSTDAFYANFICSEFNADYILPLNRQHDISTDELFLKFDLDYIHQQMINKTGKLTKEQIFYYLTQLEQIEDFDFDLVFLPNPKNPWEYNL